MRLLFRSVSATSVTGGTRGLAAFNRDFIALAPLDTGRRYPVLGTPWSGGELWVALIGWLLVGLFSLFIWLLIRSPWGRVIKAIREDEDAVRALGKNVYNYKMQSLVLGGVIGAFGGMVYAVATGRPSPTSTRTPTPSSPTPRSSSAARHGCSDRSIGACCCCSSCSSPTPGCRLLIEKAIIPTGMLSSTDVAQIRYILVGIGLMLLMIFRPQGIFGDRREVMLNAR